MAAIPTSRRQPRLTLPAATLLVTAVYLAGAATALVLGGPAQRLLGLAVVAVTAARLSVLLGGRRGAGPWS